MHELELFRPTELAAGSAYELRKGVTKMKYSALFAFCLLWPAIVEAVEPPVPNGRRLREIVAERYPDGQFYIGGTTGWQKYQREPGVILDREFDYVTPENDFKQSTIHPAPDVWRWDLADAWIKHCADHQQALRIHGPISPQASWWACDDDRTADELRQNLVEYTTALYQRYDKYEQVKWFDVVNETVLGDGSWHGPKPGNNHWECPWPKIGYDESHPLRPPLYIKLAFEIANEHAPNTKLIINQHGEMEDAMWDKIKALVPYLREQGLRVDGIGWQAHIHVGWEKKPGNLEKLRALIDWAHANDLEFHVTEMNAWLTSTNRDLDAQGETFAAVVRVLLEKRDTGLVTWNVWNISDRDAFESHLKKEGCLFDREYQAKPGYYAIQKVLEETK
ncbi:endo-1,4-beta-xylanase [Aeoliella mucimassa]|uniref:endo-1,4-beta-xylanase n=1 Tax=Aeoliella mucimassa TaxID=2527972 RepID=A0A518AWJ7_9BACT|nr:endo-1,4-beta-xylanase [Aeoliella mucimassa]QDU59060.1 Endo-1,4-beta-xylanase A precursor [Aeoliella mucimassa]